MELHVYSPPEKIQFGQYAGTPLEVIYKYHPDYITYLIMEVDHFAIDIDKFMKLSNPTPVRLKNAYEFEEGFSKMYIKHSNPLSATEEVSNWIAYKEKVKKWQHSGKKLIIEEIPEVDLKDHESFRWPVGNELFSLIEKFIGEGGYKPPQHHFIFSASAQKINESKIELYDVKEYGEYSDDSNFDKINEEGLNEAFEGDSEARWLWENE